MQKKLQHKKIIVTGASGGIGEKLCWHIAKNGGIPIMIARSTEKMKHIQEEMKETLDAESYFYTADLLQDIQIDETMGQLIEEHGRIDALINNAGMGVFDYIRDMKWEDAHRMMQLNVNALIRITKLVLQRMGGSRPAHIVNIASQAGKISTPKSAVYSASKHAVIGFTNTLRQEVRSEGIFVTSVNLGPVKTNFFDTADAEGSYRRSVERYMLDPDRVAEKVVKTLFSPRREINMPWWMEAGSILYRLAPGPMEAILKSQFNKK